jgi:hypothetical protein
MQSEPIVAPQDNNQETKPSVPSSSIQHGPDLHHYDPGRGISPDRDARSETAFIETRQELDSPSSRAVPDEEVAFHTPLSSFSDSSPLASSPGVGNISDEFVSSTSGQPTRYSVLSLRSKPRCSLLHLPNGMPRDLCHQYFTMVSSY